MKKRIISAILVIVMSVLALASCAPAFNFAHESLDSYVVFDYEKFKSALQNIEIEDGEFTTNEATRLEKVEEDIFASIASAVIKNALDSDKLETGVIGNKDVVYYCYYATDADGNVFFFSNMKEASITATSTKADHVIELGSYDKDDELKDKIAEALLANGGFDFGTAENKNGYNMLLSSDFTTAADRRVSLGDKVVISYKREYKYNTYKKDDKNENYVDANGNVTTDPAEYVIESEGKTVTEICTFALVDIDVNAIDPIVKFIADGLKADADAKAANANATDKYTVSVGSTVSYKDDAGATIKEFKLNDTVKITDGKIEREETAECKYSDVKIEFEVENYGTPLTVTHTPYDKESKQKPDGLRLDSTAGQIDLKDKELTYYIFPVYYLSIPAISADSVLQHIVGKNLTDSYFDIFEDAYKNGDADVTALVKEIVDLFNESYDKSESASETHKNLVELKGKYDDASAALKEKGDKALAEDQDKVDAAEKAYKLAQREATKAAIAKLTAATFGEKNLGTELIAEYRDDTYDKLLDAYEKHITEAVEKKVYELIFENDEICKIKADIVYPEKLLKEFKTHLYEAYEHDFYNGSYSSSSTSSESNYKHYGTLEKYLYAATGAEKLYGSTVTDKATAIDMALDKEAKEAIDPLLKLYAVAQALDADGVAAKVVEYINKDIEAGAYLARYEDSDLLNEKENKQAKELAEKNAKENEEDAKKNAQSFLITDEVFKAYKKDIGSSAYRSYEEQYGEINIRASMQFNRLFYYLTCTDLVNNEEDNTTDIAYTAAEDGKIAFRTISYTLVEDDGLDHDAEADGSHDHDGDGVADH